MDHEPGSPRHHGAASDASPGVADASGRPAHTVVLVHGFTQNRHCWSPVAETLAHRFEVVAIDAPGHGDAAALAMDLATAGEQYGRDVGPAVWVGYSMGGRLALHVALAHPKAVTALVLVGTSPGIADANERQARRRADNALADRIETMGVASFIDNWLSQPLFANLDASNDHRSQRVSNTASGLASSLRLAGTGAQQSLWEHLGAITCPVLLVTGADDTKFTALAHTMAPLFGGRCDVTEVSGAGHSVHLEEPDAFAAIVTDWIASVVDDSGGQTGQPAGTP